MMVRFFLFGIFAHASAFASNTKSANQLEEWLPQGCYHSGTFQQERKLSGSTTALIVNGRFLYSCDNGLIWINEDPIKEQLIYRNDGKTIRLDTEGLASELNGRVDRIVAKMLTGLMQGGASQLEKQFSVQSGSDGVELLPKRKRMRKYISSLQLSKTNAGPKSSLLFASGDVLEFTFGDIEYYEELNGDLCFERGIQKNVCQLAFGNALK